MNMKMKSLHSLKTLPLIAALAIGLALLPTLSMADNGDRGGHKKQYSHDDRQSHSKGHKSSNTHSNKGHYKSHDNSHKSKNRYSSKYRNKKGYGHDNSHAHYKPVYHDRHRAHHHTTYVVNDRHYSDYSYGLDPLRFMIGLHTNNVDIIFRD
jgi:hypothetical protein